MAVFVKLVQKLEREIYIYIYIKGRNNKQNNTKSQNTQNKKQIHKQENKYKKYIKNHKSSNLKIGNRSK